MATTTDDGPVSEFLRRPLTKFNDGHISVILRRILADPATNKIFTIIFSGILIRMTSLAPLLTIHIISLIYSCISLFIVIFKKQEAISNSNVLKKFFGGREVYWHEIQTTMSFTLAFANICGVVYGGIFSVLIITFFGLDWYFGAVASKTFIHEENNLEGKCCLKCVTGLFKRFPFFFNTLRLGLFIVVLVSVAVNQNNAYAFFMFCISFAILSSALLWLIQLSTRLEKAISTKLIPGHKWRTYFLLIASVYAFLAVLTFSIIVYRYYEEKQWKDNYEKRQEMYQQTSGGYYYNNGGYYERYDNNNTRGRYNQNKMDTTTDYERTTTNYYYYIRGERFHVPYEGPIELTLLCVAFVLSLLDLYSRAIHSKSRPETNEAYEPLTTKWDNLPKVITFPENNGESEKQIDI